jgi:hypothetical protein
MIAWQKLCFARNSVSLRIASGSKSGWFVRAQFAPDPFSAGDPADTLRTTRSVKTRRFRVSLLDSESRATTELASAWRNRNPLRDGGPGSVYGGNRRPPHEPKAVTDVLSSSRLLTILAVAARPTSPSLTERFHVIRDTVSWPSALLGSISHPHRLGVVAT